MTKKQLISLIFVFAAVFSFTFGFNMNVTAGGNDPPIWCYNGAIVLDGDQEADGQCCVDGDQEGTWVEVTTDVWECLCTGVPAGPSSFTNPCGCNLNCGEPR